LARGLGHPRSDLRTLNVVTVIGARPQFIKAAVVSRALAAQGGFSELLLHTGQHYDPRMSDVFFDELELPSPAWHLGIGSAPHGQQTGRMLEAIEGVLVDSRPDWVIVYGDTNSTLAGALAAAKLHIPVAHVEAGLRSFNRGMPEEINRIVTDHVATILFAPTPIAMDHLAREGIAEALCHLVGDVMYDSVLHLGPRAEQASSVLAREGLEHGRYVLATIHRAENTDSIEHLMGTLAGLESVAQEIPVVLPLHPRTRALLAEAGNLSPMGAGLRLIEPVGYLEMLALERGARLIVTDSGGVQKEAFFQRVPCLTLRHETEWTELLDAGWNRLVPPVSAEAIARALREALVQPRPPEPIQPLYGGGSAGVAIAALLAEAHEASG
jgi:UDP-GlcNAc3NAcA epimerase